MYIFLTVIILFSYIVVNIQLIAALDNKGIIHLYTIANFPLSSKLKLNTKLNKVNKSKKSKKTKSNSKKSKAITGVGIEKEKEAPSYVSAWSNMKESMTLPLEHNVVDYTIDTSDSKY